MSEVGWLRSPSPVFVTARYRNVTVAPGVRPETTAPGFAVEDALRADGRLLGVGDGNDALPVIFFTMPGAHVIRAGTFTGSLRDAIVRYVDFDVVVMGCHLRGWRSIIES
jgi:hypothetical protein